MNRTQEEIVARVRTEKGRDPFGWAISDLLVWLDFDHAKEFLKDGATAEEWEKSTATRKEPRDEMADYMPFAWEKANDGRGLSAARSMNHYTNWLWLAGEDALADSMADYEFYGKDNLVRVCEWLGLDAALWDDERRSNHEE